MYPHGNWDDVERSDGKQKLMKKNQAFQHCLIVEVEI